MSVRCELYARRYTRRTAHALNDNSYAAGGDRAEQTALHSTKTEARWEYSVIGVVCAGETALHRVQVQVQVLAKGNEYEIIT